MSSRFWRIACFVTYRLYSTPEPRDALHHQQQAILRNSSSADSGFWTLCQLAWAWRESGKRCLIKTLPSILTSAFCLAAFTTAGGFSSQISSGIGNEVLIKGDNCSTVIFNNVTVADKERLGLSWNSKMVNNAANYAQQCYSANTYGISDCTSFVEANPAYRRRSKGRMSVPKRAMPKQ